MEWRIRGEGPIYAQLMEQIQQAVASGVFLPGERLASVRELAAQAGVNPNTMQRALQELEREGLVYTQRTAGRFVTRDRETIERVKRELAQARIEAFLSAMETLGYSGEEIVSLVRENSKEEEKHERDSGM